MSSSRINKLTLRYAQQYLENMFLEDESINIRKLLKIIIYTGYLLSILLLIYSIFNNVHLVNLLIIVFVIVGLMIYAWFFTQRTSIKYLNIHLSLFNIMFAILINYTINIFSRDIMDADEQVNTNFIFGACAFCFHSAIQIGTNFFLNSLSFLIISLIYVFTCFPPLYIFFGVLIFLNLISIVSNYFQHLNKRLYYDLVEKNFIWYFIANKIIPSKIILSRYNYQNGEIHLIQCNTKAKRGFQLKNHQDLNIFLNKVILENQINQKDDQQEKKQELEEEQEECQDFIKEIELIKLSSKRQILKEEELNLDQIEVDQYRVKSGIDIKLKSNNNNEYSLDSAMKQSNQIKLNTIISNSSEQISDTSTKHSRFNSNFLGIGQNDDLLLQKIVSLRLNENNLQNTVNRLVKREKINLQTVVKIQNDNSDENSKDQYELQLCEYQLSETFHLTMIEETKSIQKQKILKLKFQFFSQNCLNLIAQIKQIEQDIKGKLKKIDSYLPQNIDNHSKQFTNQNYNDQAWNVIKVLISNLDLDTITLSNYTKYLIQFINISQQTIKYKQKQINFQFLIQKCISSLQILTEERKIEILFSNKLKNSEQTIFNDSKILKLILTNFMINTIISCKKDMIIISLQRAFEQNDVDNEIHGLDSSDLSKVLKVSIHYTYQKDWTSNYKTYKFKTGNIQNINSNEGISIQDLIISINNQLLGLVGPYRQFFTNHNIIENQNRISFYIFSNQQDPEKSLQLEENQIVSQNISLNLENLKDERLFNDNIQIYSKDFDVEQELNQIQIDDEKNSVASQMNKMNFPIFINNKQNFSKRHSMPFIENENIGRSSENVYSTRNLPQCSQQSFSELKQER